MGALHHFHRDFLDLRCAILQWVLEIICSGVLQGHFASNLARAILWIFQARESHQPREEIL